MSVHPLMDMDNELICNLNQTYPFTMSKKKHVSKNKNVVMSYVWESFVPDSLFSLREYSLKSAIGKNKVVGLTWVENLLKFDKIISYGYACSNLSIEITCTLCDLKIKIWITCGFFLSVKCSSKFVINR